MNSISSANASRSHLNRHHQDDHRSDHNDENHGNNNNNDSFGYDDNDDENDHHSKCSSPRSIKSSATPTSPPTSPKSPPSSPPISPAASATAALRAAAARAVHSTQYEDASADTTTSSSNSSNSRASWSVVSARAESSLVRESSQQQQQAEQDFADEDHPKNHNHNQKEHKKKTKKKTTNDHVEEEEDSIDPTNHYPNILLEQQPRPRSRTRSIAHHHQQRSRSLSLSSRNNKPTNLNSDAPLYYYQQPSIQRAVSPPQSPTTLHRHRKVNTNHKASSSVAPETAPTSPTATTARTSTTSTAAFPSPTNTSVVLQTSITVAPSSTSSTSSVTTSKTDKNKFRPITVAAAAAAAAATTTTKNVKDHKTRLATTAAITETVPSPETTTPSSSSVPAKTTNHKDKRDSSDKNMTRSAIMTTTTKSKKQQQKKSVSFGTLELTEKEKTEEIHRRMRLIIQNGTTSLVETTSTTTGDDATTTTPRKKKEKEDGDFHPAAAAAVNKKHSHKASSKEDHDAHQKEKLLRRQRREEQRRELEKQQQPQQPQKPPQLQQQFCCHPSHPPRNQNNSGKGGSLSLSEQQLAALVASFSDVEEQQFLLGLTGSSNAQTTTSCDSNSERNSPSPDLRLLNAATTVVPTMVRLIDRGCGGGSSSLSTTFGANGLLLYACTNTNDTGTDGDDDDEEDEESEESEEEIFANGGDSGPHSVKATTTTSSSVETTTSPPQGPEEKENIQQDSPNNQNDLPMAATEYSRVVPANLADTKTGEQQDDNTSALIATTALSQSNALAPISTGTNPHATTNAAMDNGFFILEKFQQYMVSMESSWNFSRSLSGDSKTVAPPTTAAATTTTTSSSSNPQGESTPADSSTSLASTRASTESIILPLSGAAGPTDRSKNGKEHVSNGLLATRQGPFKKTDQFNDLQPSSSSSLFLTHLPKETSSFAARPKEGRPAPLNGARTTLADTESESPITTQALDATEPSGASSSAEVPGPTTSGDDVFAILGLLRKFFSLLESSWSSSSSSSQTPYFGKERNKGMLLLQNGQQQEPEAEFDRDAHRIRNEEDDNSTVTDAAELQLTPVSGDVVVSYLESEYRLAVTGPQQKKELNELPDPNNFGGSKCCNGGIGGSRNSIPRLLEHMLPTCSPLFHPPDYDDEVPTTSVSPASFLWNRIMGISNSALQETLSPLALPPPRKKRNGKKSVSFSPNLVETSDDVRRNDQTAPNHLTAQGHIKPILKPMVAGQTIGETNDTWNGELEYTSSSSTHSRESPMPMSLARPLRLKRTKRGIQKLPVLFDENGNLWATPSLETDDDSSIEFLTSLNVVHSCNNRANESDSESNISDDWTRHVQNQCIMLSPVNHLNNNDSDNDNDDDNDNDNDNDNNNNNDDDNSNDMNNKGGDQSSITVLPALAPDTRNEEIPIENENGKEISTRGRTRNKKNLPCLDTEQPRRASEDSNVRRIKKTARIHTKKGKSEHEISDPKSGDLETNSPKPSNSMDAKAKDKVHVTTGTSSNKTPAASLTNDVASVKQARSRMMSSMGGKNKPANKNTLSRFGVALLIIGSTGVLLIWGFHLHATGRLDSLYAQYYLERQRLNNYIERRNTLAGLGLEKKLLDSATSTQRIAKATPPSHATMEALKLLEAQLQEKNKIIEEMERRLKQQLQNEEDDNRAKLHATFEWE
ncbi:hypothetical protein ACA910_001290 [Epithemia clementina (nom. ined.)]